MRRSGFVWNDPSAEAAIELRPGVMSTIDSGQGILLGRLADRGGRRVVVVDDYIPDRDWTHLEEILACEGKHAVGMYGPARADARSIIGSCGLYVYLANRSAIVTAQDDRVAIRRPPA